MVESRGDALHLACRRSSLFDLLERKMRLAYALLR
jgi:hypothetical protein